MTTTDLAPDLQLLELVRSAPHLARAHPMLWALHASQGRWRAARHLKFLADACVETARTPNGRLLVSMPPRHGKTQFIWRYFGAWWFASNPDLNLITVTYQERQAKRFSRQMRDDLHNYGRDVFGVWAERRAGTSEWAVRDPDGRARAGLVNAIGAQGAITGKGFNGCVLDDAIKGIQQASSPAQRDALYDWFDADLMTRAEPDSWAIGIGTRWHDDDLIGRILAAQTRGEPPGGYTWRVINLGAIAEPGDELGRAEGEALWESRWSRAALERKRAGMDRYTWSALYQGRPTPIEGGMFKRTWIREAEIGRETVTMHGKGTVLLRDMTVFVTADLSATKKTSSDPWVGCAWAALPDALVLLDRIRLRVEGPEFLKQLRKLGERWRAGTYWIESVFWQLMFIQQARKEGLPVRELVADRDKVARALPATTAMEAGEVFWAHRAPWREEWDREVLTFPGSEKDDQVDNLSYAVKVWRDHLGRSGRPPDYPTGPSAHGLIPQLNKPR